ncbi:unnamed protein product, partial [Prorocentrum cordatum]
MAPCAWRPAPAPAPAENSPAENSARSAADGRPLLSDLATGTPRRPSSAAADEEGGLLLHVQVAAGDDAERRGVAGRRRRLATAALLAGTLAAAAAAACARPLGGRARPESSARAHRGRTSLAALGLAELPPPRRETVLEAAQSGVFGDDGAAAAAGASCAAYGCGGSYNPLNGCQCNDECVVYNSCCHDFE